MFCVFNQSSSKFKELQLRRVTARTPLSGTPQVTPSFPCVEKQAQKCHLFMDR